MKTISRTLGAASVNQTQSGGSIGFSTSPHWSTVSTPVGHLFNGAYFQVDFSLSSTGSVYYIAATANDTSTTWNYEYLNMGPGDDNVRKWHKPIGLTRRHQLFGPSGGFLPRVTAECYVQGQNGHNITLSWSTGSLEFVYYPVAVGMIHT